MEPSSTADEDLLEQPDETDVARVRDRPVEDAHALGPAAELAPSLEHRVRGAETSGRHVAAAGDLREVPRDTEHRRRAYRRLPSPDGAPDGGLTSLVRCSP